MRRPLLLHVGTDRARQAYPRRTTSVQRPQRPATAGQAEIVPTQLATPYRVATLRRERRETSSAPTRLDQQSRRQSRSVLTSYQREELDLRRGNLPRRR